MSNRPRFDALYPPSDDAVDAWHEAQIDRSSCPYYRDQVKGQCASGCWEEPLCFTDRPIDGWPSERQTSESEAAR